MKISQNQKQKNRSKIIKIAVDIMIEHGFKSATMRTIAKEAGIGDATIYNYFPTKEAILYAYYEESLNECIARLKAIERFNEFTLAEQLQTFLDIQLELFLPDREFIELSFKRIFFSLSHTNRGLQPIREIFQTIVSDMFNAAVEVGEIPEQVFQEMINHLFWDYYIGVIMFWLKDGSDQFSDTTVMVDKTLDLICATLKTGLINKAFEITSYLFKNHILGRLDSFQQGINTFQTLKREFMGTFNEKGNPRK